VQRRARQAFAIAVVVLILLATFSLTPFAQNHLHAAGVLARMQGPERHDWITRVGAYQVAEPPLPNATANTERIYLPIGKKKAPGMVLLHGMHHLGMDEPRLVQFARIFASYGIVVLTPQLPALADYRVDEGEVALIGNAAREFASTLHVKSVGVVGISFAGGLALMAASRQEYSDSISYVASIGGYDDLARVVRYFATDDSPRPDGSTLHLPSHPYGPLVVVYEHLPDFFSGSDVLPAQACLRDLLWEKGELVQQCSTKLSAPGQARMAEIIRDQRQAFIAPLLHEVEQHATEMQRVSPHGKLSALRVPVLLLHGAGDNVIPPSETDWLEQDIPARCLRAALISPAISHVELDKSHSGDVLRLVHWIAALLSQANDSPHGRIPDHW
jgi:dienelactone hydrolase